MLPPTLFLLLLSSADGTQKLAEDLEEHSDSMKPSALSIPDLVLGSKHQEGKPEN